MRVSQLSWNTLIFSNNPREKKELIVEFDEHTKQMIKDVKNSYSKEQIESWQKAAELGDAEAQFQLGTYYFFYDDEKAVEWFRKAAERGHAAAHYNLYICYGNGRGVAQNYEKAFFHLTKSAESDYGEAQYMLGLLYESQKQYLAAVDWFSRAMQHGKGKEAYEEIKKLLPGVEKRFPGL